ncbi:cytidine deaminase [Fodinibacter luteus]|uniref:Cytidine deaminase n=1 Tax=Fodinibacter luteus TaxID=552064 RepID=A0ABP8JZR0_9MICO
MSEQSRPSPPGGGGGGGGAGTTPDVDWDALHAEAVRMTTLAYAPYSRYRVGVAGVVDDGRVVSGCNVENAGYGVTLCAECGMVSQLHATGGGLLVAVYCVDGAGDALMPCGRCRQLLWENGTPDTLLMTPEGVMPMREVLPQAFGPDNLRERP